MVFKKWHKPVKKGEKITENVVENEVKNEQNVGTTVVENEISNEVENELTNIQQEVKNEQIREPVEQTENTKNIMWTVWTNAVVRPKWQIKFEAQVAPVPMFKVPADIRQYLINNGLTTDVRRKDKEWLEKHNVDMEMVAKLKNFLTNM